MFPWGRSCVQDVSFAKLSHEFKLRITGNNLFAIPKPFLIFKGNIILWYRVFEYSVWYKLRKINMLYI